jgi:flagellar basal-body rod modification protein FlgD
MTVTPTAATTSSPATPAASASPTDSLANEQTFLKLLVAQIQNQDPTSPTDSTQFVTQLAQFSQLEQLIGIRQDLDAQKSAATAPPAS